MNERTAKDDAHERRIDGTNDRMIHALSSLKVSTAQLAANTAVQRADNAPFIHDLRLMGVRI